MKIDQQQIREYLLGRPAASVDQFEEQLFSDENLYLAVQEEQDLLIEEFVRGYLNKDDTLRFQQQCKLSSTLAQKVSDFSLLTEALEQRELQMRASQFPVRSSGWQMRRLVPLFAGIACLLLVSAVLTFYRRSSSSSPTAPPLPVEQHTAQSKTAPAGKEVTFFLASAITRGDSSRPLLKITPETSGMNLQVQLPRSQASMSSWSIEILHGTAQVWTSAEVHPQSIGQEVFLSVHLDPSTMPDGLYTVRMKPLKSAQTAQSREFVLEQAK